LIRHHLILPGFENSTGFFFEIDGIFLFNFKKKSIFAALNIKNNDTQA